tara:strand:- start:59 stop:1048 length:990 start_codon:yes stop_codon:yes gene_type:complete
MSKRKIIEETTLPCKKSKPNEKNQHNIKWENNLKKLEDFYKLYHHYNVPSKFVEDQQLAIWVKKQKTHINKNTMKKERLKILQDKGIVKSWSKRKYSYSSTHLERNYYSNKWKESFKKLKDFYEIHGHFNVPNDKVNRSLYFWTYKEFKQIRDSKMKPEIFKKRRKIELEIIQERIKQLENIGAYKCWMKRTSEYKFNTNLEKLIEFGKNNDGNFNVHIKVNENLANYFQTYKNGWRQYLKDPPSITERMKERLIVLKEKGIIDSWFPSKKSDEETEEETEEESEDETEEETEDKTEEKSEDETEEETEKESEDESNDVLIESILANLE